MQVEGELSMPEGRSMKIGEAAAALNTTTRALRYYEDQGLLSPGRTDAGYRTYTEHDLMMVRRVQQLLTAGLSSTTVAVVLPCLSSHDGRLAPTCPEVLGELRRERDRIDRAITALASSRTALDEVIDAGEHGATAG